MIITNFRNKLKIQSMTKSILMLVTSISMLFAVVFTEGNQARAESEAERQVKIVHTYKCNDGSSFRARFDNTGNFFIAILDLGQAFEIPLIETVSGSGSRYSNDDYTLQTKGEEAVLTKQGNISVCSTTP
jgi:membrane-bound inhibitor of C-type lysozyme